MQPNERILGSFLKNSDVVGFHVASVRVEKLNADALSVGDIKKIFASAIIDANVERLEADSKKFLARSNCLLEVISAPRKLRT